MEKQVVIAGACRTPVGKMGGLLSRFPAARLGSIVISEALRRAQVPAEQVDQVLMGCVLQAAQGQNIARQAALGAGLPAAVPAQTLNTVCGSGLESVNLAAALIRSGEADIMVAGGMESMSSAPFALEKARFGYRMNNGVLVDTMVHDALWDAMNDYHMGITAENLAEKYGITREKQDEFAVASQRKCEEARKSGRFHSEIVPVSVSVQKEIRLIDFDESPRDNVTSAQLARLRPAFKENGTVTAGNSSGINDGAAAVVVMSAEKASELGVKPQASYLGGAIAGVEPAFMGIGPVASTRKLLKRMGRTVRSFDLIEANEAFAAQSLAVGMELGWDSSLVNVNGGAIAIGHPVGASGCRILVTLIQELLRRGASLGLATLCVGGGMGVSAAVSAIR